MKLANAVAVIVMLTGANVLLSLILYIIAWYRTSG